MIIRHENISLATLQLPPAIIITYICNNKNVTKRHETHTQQYMDYPQHHLCRMYGLLCSNVGVNPQGYVGIYPAYEYIFIAVFSNQAQCLKEEGIIALIQN